MTKEKLIARIQELTQAQMNHIANANACAGAKAELENMLAELEKEKVVTPE